MVPDNSWRRPRLYFLPVFVQHLSLTLENFSGTVKIAGIEEKNLRFADDIDLLAGSREELADLTSRLDSTAKKYGMEISAGKVRRWLHQELPQKDPR